MIRSTRVLLVHRAGMNDEEVDACCFERWHDLEDLSLVIDPGTGLYG